MGQPPAPGAVLSIVFSRHHTTMEEFAHNVHGWAGDYFTHPLVDSTGLKGSWDFDIKWTPKGQLQKAGPDGISAYTLIAVSPKLRKADPLSRTRCIEGPGPDGKHPSGGPNRPPQNSYFAQTGGWLTLT